MSEKEKQEAKEKAVADFKKMKAENPELFLGPRLANIQGLFSGFSPLEEARKLWENP